MTHQSTETKIGDKMPDGTIYAGISLAAAPADASLTMRFTQ